jgi:choline kinase
VDAIVLAAGTGSRLLSLTRQAPKALVKVNNRALLDYAISFATSLNCQRITVVGGFYFDDIGNFVREMPDVILLENPDFLKGSILTVAKALDVMEDSFLLLNVDHIYPTRLAKMLSSELPRQSSVTAIVDFDRPLAEDDMKVLVDPKHRIKKIAKTLAEFDAGYIGLTYVPKQAMADYRSAITHIARTDEGSNVEKVLQYMADNGSSPAILDASGFRWLEVDNQADLMNAERILRNKPDFLS